MLQYIFQNIYIMMNWGFGVTEDLSVDTMVTLELCSLESWDPGYPVKFQYCTSSISEVNTNWKC